MDELDQINEGLERLEALIDEAVIEIEGIKRHVSKRKPLQLLTTMMGLDTDNDGIADDPLSNRYAEWNMQKASMISQKWITVDGWHWNQEKTDEWLAAYCPEDYEGYLIGDWEGGLFTSIREGYSDPIEECREFLFHIRNVRPGAKVGMYGIPTREYWNQDKKWWDSNLNVAQPIVDGSHVIMPSCYDFYGDNPERDLERFGKIVELALLMAGDKQVIPFVQPRYHNSTEQWGFRTIPDDEFRTHLNGLIDSRFDGSQIAGLCVWGADPYYYRTSQLKRDDGTFLYIGAKWDRIRTAYAREMGEDSFERYIEKRYERIYTTMNEVATRGVA